MREFDLPDTPGAETDADADAVAQRLDALQMDSVERVLRRAIELQSDDEHGPDTLDGEAIKKIARELGIDAAHVEQALFEERVGDRVERLRWLDRMLAPAHVSGQTVVAAPLHEVASSADAWLERHEGLRKRRAIEGGAVWEKDPSALTSIRMGLKIGRGSGALRSVGGVAHRIHSSPTGEQMVVLDVDTRMIGGVAKGLLAAGLGVGVLLLGLVGTSVGWPQGVWAGLTGFVTFGTAAVVTAKTWIGRIRKGVRRALDAIANPGVAGVHETLARRVSKSLRDWTELGRDVRRRL